ncbi:hypothetical protein [Vallitalea guaymasensis]|uniref:hypothetical protein n=1 Tax=Vallitalea guaymasensis TaxID=1185412 RepID=UPI000DE229FA|nr:hypothetical protein [Vallitalea guaymasensis]
MLNIIDTMKNVSYDYITSLHPDLKSIHYPVIATIIKLTELESTHKTIKKIIDGSENDLTIKVNNYICAVRVLDNDLEENENKPPIPNVKIKDIQEYAVGDKIYVCFLYNDLSYPLVIGKVI